MSTLHRVKRQKPARIDIEIKQGSTFTFGLGIVETIDPLTYLDLSGWTARAKIRKGDAGGAVQLDMSTSNGRITLGLQGTPEDGQYNVLITVPATTTDALTDWGYGIWDMEFEDAFGHVECWVEGVATLNRAVTR